MNKRQKGHGAAFYESPGTEIIEAPRQVIICQSNGSLTEDYLGDGGFTEENN